MDNEDEKSDGNARRDDGTPYIERALILRDQQRRDLAAADLRRHLADHPDDSYAHSLLAACLAEAGHTEEALTEAREAVRLRPDDGYAYRICGYVLLLQGQAYEAEGVLNEALRREPTDADHHALLATIRLSRKNARGALEASNNGLTLDAENASLHNTRGRALTDLGRADEALEAFDEALRLEPENAYAHTNKGWVYVESRRTKQALESFREALHLEPNLEKARDGMLTALREQYFLPGVLHRYSRWVMRLSPWKRVLASLFFLVFFNTATNLPFLASFFWLIVTVYGIVAFVTYSIGVVLDTTLRFNEFGRYLLTPEQITLSNWLIGTVTTSVLSMGIWLARHQPGWICIAAALPIVVTFLSKAEENPETPLLPAVYFFLRTIIPISYIVLIFVLALWMGL